MSAIQMAPSFKWDMKRLFSRASGRYSDVRYSDPACGCEVKEWKSFVLFTNINIWLNDYQLHFNWKSKNNLGITIFKSFPNLAFCCYTQPSMYNLFVNSNNIHKSCIWEFVVIHWLNNSNRETSYIEVFYIEGWLNVDFYNWNFFLLWLQNDVT